MPPSPDSPDELPPMTAAEEAEMQAEIERALAPYRAITPAPLLAAMRENLEHALRTHPAPRAYMRAFIARPEVDSSAEITRGGTVAGEDDVNKKEGA